MAATTFSVFWPTRNLGEIFLTSYVIKMSQNVAPKFRCEKCDYNTCRLSDFKRHIDTITHNVKNMSTNVNEISPISFYHCSDCSYTTSKHNDFQKHKMTKRHIQREKKEAKDSKHTCGHCGKNYSAQSSLSRHRRTCVQTQDIVLPVPSIQPIQPIPQVQAAPIIEENTLMQFITQSKDIQNLLIEQNKEMQEIQRQNLEYQKQIIELSKQQTQITNNTTNNTTNNNQFNLHFFLNNTCKDALNINDFIKSLNIQVTDLEETGNLGFIEGITRIIVNGLKDVDVTKRPLHCTDLKRETVYIKNDNAWEKENQEKAKLKQAIERVSSMNLQQLRKWQEIHPLFKDTSTKENDMFIHLSTQAIGSCTKEQGERNIDKIMKNVMREVVLVKSATT